VTATRPITPTRPQLAPGTRTARTGGRIFVAAAALYVAASVIQADIASDPANHGPLFWTFFCLMSASGIVGATAMIPLAFGVRGDVGITGRSDWGRGALLLLGVMSVTWRELALVGTYWGDHTPIDGPNVVASLVRLATIAVGIVAAAAVVQARVLSGAARWSLWIAVLVGIVAAALRVPVTSIDGIRVLEVIGAAAHAFVAISFATARGRSAGQVSRTRP
jgi:hypothetical protein